MDVGDQFGRNKDRVEDRENRRLAHPEPHYTKGVRPPTPEEKKMIEQTEEYKPSEHKKRTKEQISAPTGGDKPRQ